MAPLLEIENLQVDFVTRKKVVHAVRRISFAMDREKVGIVGESGSGKSVTGRSILGLVRHPGKLNADTLRFDGCDLRGADKKTWQGIRGRRISMVMQDPKFSLNPVMTIGRQIIEASQSHQRISRKTAWGKAVEMLEAVQIRGAERVMKQFPHEVSGGMGQRIMIAMMLVTDPDLLIADEPTSALDVTVQLQLLAVLDDLVTSRGMGLLFISHDLNLVASFCDRVLIMYGGQIMEECKASELHKAQHPYTRGLLDCLPSLEHERGSLAVLKRDPAWLEQRL